MLSSMDSALPPKSERPVSLRKPLRQLSLGQDSMPASPLISTRNLVPGLSDSVVKLDRLGKGATSNVFRAVHAATLKMIALKEVTVSNDADRRAVRTEMRALHTQRSPLLTSTFTTELASCPRIVDYYGSVVQENGNACIAVEYVAGGSLGSWLDSGCLCPEAWIAHIAHQALEALDFVHSGGRVHRDVKPANLLITKNGDLKLGDFGAAGVENSSRMVGTQRFMAPERLKGRRATAQSDLWSLGLSLATAVLGDDFISQASNQFEQLDLAGRARRTLAKATTLSADLTDFLHQCLSRDPARRPALRELMKHPFLERRHRWQSKCPEVALAMRDRNRRQREEASVGRLSPDDVIDALCRVRADVNVVGTRVDPAMAADLAYELGVSAQSLVRNVYRRTLELIRERGSVSTAGSACGDCGSISGSGSGSVNGGDCGGGGGGGGRSGGGNCDGRSCGVGGDCGGGGLGGGGDTPGVSDSGGGSGAEEGGCRGGGGGGSATTGRRRRRRSVTIGGGCAEEPGCTHSDGSLSPLRSLEDEDRAACGRRSSRRLEARGRAKAGAGVAAPMATVGGGGGGRDCHHYAPLSTPRNRSIGGFSGSATTGNGRATPYGSSCGGGGGRGDPSSCSRRGRRRVLEVPSSVKLTPHKRRGERKSKRNGSSSACCEKDGARRSRGRRVRAKGLAARPGKQDAIVAGAGGGAGAAAPSGRRHRSKKEASGGSGGGGRSGGCESGDCCCRSGGEEEGGGSGDAVCRRRHRKSSGQSQSQQQNQRKSRDKPRTSASRALPSRADVSQRSMRGVFQMADEMKAEISVRDRVHRLRVYPNCFSGREAVQWMLDGCHASSVMEAEKLGNEMMKASVFQHIRNSHVFEDSSVYYQFTDGETPPPPARGGRRLRQIARVFGGHVARKLVYNGIVGGSNGGGGDAGGSGGTGNGTGPTNKGGTSGGGSDSRSRKLSVARKAKSATGGTGGGGGSSHCTADRCVCGSSKQQQQQRSPLASGATTATSAADSVAGSTKSSTTSSFSTFRQPLGGKGKPPRLPASGSTDRNSKHRRRRNASGASESQLRRFSSSMSTATVPETPY